jgi:uncharacterized protein (DUF983 family)
VPLAIAALGCRCPRCGKGPLFRGLLRIRDRCPVCDLDLAGNDVGDGPAALIILVLGSVVVGLALWVEIAFSPPIWVHVLVWPVVTIPAAIWLMRVMKAGLVAVQFRYRASEMGMEQ